MFDAKRLIDQFLGAGGAANLEKTLGGMLGQGGQSSGQQGGGRAGDLVGRGRDYVSNNAGALATGALAGGLLSLVLGSKGGRKLGGSALKLGGLAVIGGLAYKAYQDYQAGRPPLGVGVGTRGGAAPAPQADEPALLPPPSTAAFTSDTTAHLVRVAMISAAKADGHLDDKERARIHGELGSLDGEAQAFMDAELAKPIDIDALAARATSPELATQVYAASLVAIDPDTDVERAYLSELATRLNLDPALKSHLEATVAQAKASA